LPSAAGPQPGHGKIYDSNTILKLDRIPKILAVVGAGVIGVHIMGDLATEVLSIGPVAMMCNASANLFDAGQILVPIKVVPEAALPKLRRSGYFRLAA
jgi:pyruvate/2-oxoglutarate dehydrogenase complex dihydrolipoamide dehydrogenase (E3) component